MATPRSFQKGESVFHHLRVHGTVLGETIFNNAKFSGTVKNDRVFLSAAKDFISSAGTKTLFLLQQSKLLENTRLNSVSFTISKTAAATGTILCRVQAMDENGNIGTFSQNIAANVIGGTNVASGNLNVGAFTMNGSFGTLIAEYWYRDGATVHGGVGTTISFFADCSRAYEA